MTCWLEWIITRQLLYRPWTTPHIGPSRTFQRSPLNGTEPSSQRNRVWKHCDRTCLSGDSLGHAPPLTVHTGPLAGHHLRTHTPKVAWLIPRGPELAEAGVGSTPWLRSRAVLNEEIQQLLMLQTSCQSATQVLFTGQEEEEEEVRAERCPDSLWLTGPLTNTSSLCVCHGGPRQWGGRGVGGEAVYCSLPLHVSTSVFNRAKTTFMTRKINNKK